MHLKVRMDWMVLIQLCLRHQHGKQTKLCAAGDEVDGKMS